MRFRHRKASAVVGRVCNRLLLLAAFAFFIFQPAHAQVSTGTISGTVHDASGAVVAGATITATNRGTSLSRSATSGADGEYRFTSLPVGTYDVKAEASGFQTKVQKDLALSVANVAVVNFTMQVGAVQQTVTVSAAPPLVQTTSGSLGGLVNQAKVEDLPLNGRSFNQLALLQTGVQVNRPVSLSSSTSIGISFSANGAPMRSNYITLDGASLASSNGVSGVSVSGTMLGVDGVREFRLITNNYTAEYGMTMGSQMVIVSKGGTNQFHGTVFDFLRNNKLDARNFFVPQKGSFHHNNFGGALGGPIRKDKTFFFANYEGVRESKGIPIRINVPTAAARTGLVEGKQLNVDPAIKRYLPFYPMPNGVLSSDPTGFSGIGTYSYSFLQPTREDFGQIRVDQNFSESDQFFVRYTIDDTDQTAPPGTGTPGFVWNRTSRGQFITAAENHTFSPTVLNTARISFSRPFQTFLSPIPKGFSFFPNSSRPMGDIRVTGLGTMGPVLPDPNDFHQNEGTFSDDISWVHGRHSMKFGVLINRFRDYLNTNNYRAGRYSFKSISDLITNNPSEMRVMFAGAISDRTLVWNTFGFYGEDDWTVSPNLTLNMGLRYEFNTTVNEVTGRGSSVRSVLTDTTATLGSALYKNPSLGNIGPRFGFAWDVTGNGKTAVRGGFGLFYDIANIGSAFDIETTGTPPYSGIVTLHGAGAVIPIATLPTPASGPLGLRTVEYRQAQPSLTSYNLTVERQLPGSMVLSVAYAGSHGYHLPATIEGDPAIPQGQPGMVNGVLGCVPVATPRTTLPGNGGPASCWLGTESRINPAFDHCECKTNGSSSYYNSLQVSFRKRMSHNLQFQASYTYAKLLDTTQGQHGGEAGGSNVTGTNPGNFVTDKGPADFNIPNYFVFNILYGLPSPDVSGFAGGLLKGWRVGSIFTAQNGEPFTVYLSGQRSKSGVLGTNGSTNSGHADRANYTPGCNAILGGPNQYYDPSCFTIQPAGFLGTEGRNLFMGPRTVNWDFSLVKDTPLHALGEGGKLEFRAEFFNFLNHTNFNIPTDGRTVYNATPKSAKSTPLATAGEISRTVTDARDIQFALKLIF